MHIFWYGQSCFKIQTNNTIIFTDPYQKEIGLTPPRTKANIVTVSHQHEDHNNVEAVADENTLVITTPGEYESKGVEICGIPSFHDSQEGKKSGANIIFIFETEGIRVCHLGDLGHLLTDEQLEKINGVDILFLPVGEGYTISVKETIKIVSQIEPKIIIPMHYKIRGLKYKLSEVDKFCKETGVKKNNLLDKFLAKKKNLPTEETQIIILKNLG
ncbi:MAG: MBL fold metallo-hydrolase [Patescibacteria group bacterium]